MPNVSSRPDEAKGLARGSQEGQPQTSDLKDLQSTDDYSFLLLLSVCLSLSPHLPPPIPLPEPVCAFSTLIFSLNKHLFASLCLVSLLDSFSKDCGDLHQGVRVQSSHPTAT